LSRARLPIPPSGHLVLDCECKFTEKNMPSKKKMKKIIIVN